MNKREELFLNAATTLHEYHYDIDTARERSETLLDVYKDELASVVSVALSRAMVDEPWWDGEDDKEVVIKQLENDILYLDSIPQFVEKLEAVLDRSLGETHEDKIATLMKQRFMLLAELQGEEYPDMDVLGQQIVAEMFGFNMDAPESEDEDEESL